MTFGVNSSPFAGQEGTNVTSTKIDDRLYKETQKDVSLRVNRIGKGDEWVVCGRGELHLGILIENMRREGYEFQVARPKPIIKEIDGVKCEPYETAVVDCPNEAVGGVIDYLNRRGGELENMETGVNQTRLHYIIPSRGLIGFSTDFMTLTKGYGTLAHRFSEYRPMGTNITVKRKFGALVATDQGVCTAYGIHLVEDRGTFFVTPKDQVYEGQIVGEHNKEDDLIVNPTKAKAATNQRSANKNVTVVLKAARKMSLDVCLEYINDDELVEVTPKSIRLRKKILFTEDRLKWEAKVRNGKAE